MKKTDAKMWAGRFEEEQNPVFEAINCSIAQDKFLAEFDIKGSKGHVQGLTKIKIFSKEEEQDILAKLDEISAEISQGTEEPLSVDEDVHMWVERLLTKKLGELGKKIHTARSRNDQVVTSEKLWMKAAYTHHQEDLIHLIDVMVKMAKKYKEVMLPGFTHLQAAQPITLGFYFMCYASKLKRDYERFIESYSRLDVMPLGSGALAGVNYPVDRQFVAEKLGFSKISENAMDSVSDRDFVSEYLYLGSTLFVHLSSLAEDFILWNSPAYGYVVLADEFSSGSSIMPQKKNPDGFELIRGKAAVMSGRLVSMLGVMKGLAMSYNKDFQSDKELMYGAYKDIDLALKLLPPMLETVNFNEEAMMKQLKNGYVNATDLADALVETGISFREAHKLVGKVVANAVKERKALEDLSKSYYEMELPMLKPEKIYEILDYKNCINNKQTQGSTSPKYVQKQIDFMTDWLCKK
ncbi:MAG: argininosuccinate lyase [Eubacteriales bacterium]